MATLPIAFISIHGDPLAPLGGPSHGGQNVYVRELSHHLGTYGFRVDVFSRWESPDQPPTEAIGPTAQVIRVQVGPPQYLPKEQTILFLPELVQWIARSWEERRADYRLVHGHYYFSGAVAMALRAQKSVPFVQTFHSLGLVKRRALGQQDPSPTQRLEIERRIVREADRIIATTPQEKQDLMTAYAADAERIRVIPCGVNLDLFRPLPRQEARMYINLPEELFLVTFVGRLERRKGIDTLLEAMGLLLTERPDLPLHAVIVGGRPKGSDDKQPEMEREETAECQRLQALLIHYNLVDRVTFTGGLPQNVLRYYYSAGDVTVIPSYYEPFGMTALEALACGSSVIASRVGGLKTTVLEGRVGLQFEPQNAQDLAEKLLYLMEHPEVNARFRRNARPYVERHYSWPSIAERVAAVYRELLS